MSSNPAVPSKASMISQPHLNPSIQGLTESPTLRINQHSKELVAAGRKVYKLGLGQSPFPVPESVVAALRAHAPVKDYLHVQGLPELRKAVAAFHQRKDGVDIAADNVIIGPGSKELLFILQLVADAEILIPSPSWVSYLPQSKIVGKKIHVLHTNVEDRWRLTGDQLQKFCRENVSNTTKPYLLILNYPGNPDGLTYNEQELKDIAVAARQNNVIILSDEIYGELHHEGKHISIARYYPEGTIISSGLSKWCGAGGWRLGTFSFPQNLSWLLTAMKVVASESFTSVSAPIQFAAIPAFECGPEIENYLSHVRRILKDLGRKCARILQDGGIGVNDPTGGFYLFIDFSAFADLLIKNGFTNSLQLSDRILDDTGVAFLPGSDFSRPEDEFTARLSYVNFDGDKALEASYPIPLDQPLPEDFIRTYCADTLEAMEKIVGWIQQQ